MTLRIANAAGFWGDQPSAARQLVEASTVDYLTLEYLAELTMSILARLREKDPQAGYATDFIDVLHSLKSLWPDQLQLKIITNAGGMNPLACATSAAEVMAVHQLGDVPIGVVTGDDLLPRIADLLRSGEEFLNLDTGAPLSSLTQPIVSANAYLGARPITEALGQGARLVITGRVADASLTVGPAMHTFQGDWTDWDTLAAYSVAGHLIECGAQVTGGYTTDWLTVQLADVGYPIAELDRDGATIITKPPATGGRVTRRTVIEQLAYEIGDPQHYLTPDVDVDFTTVEVTSAGENRVLVQGASGRPATDSYKVSLAYRDGYLAAGELLVYGRDAAAKGEACAEIVLQRVARAGYALARTHVEFLGAGAAAGQTSNQQPNELVLRIAAHDPRREALECFTRQFAPLITSGPAGLAGYAAGRPSIRPVFAYWPTLVPKALVTPNVEVRTANEWANQAK